jgi:peroxiredoxin
LLGENSHVATECTTMSDYNTIPDNLPVPQDDGATQHLKGLSLPSVTLMGTHGAQVDVGHLKGWVVIYCYPMTGVPGVPLPSGWDQIPGARGCTPQSNAYKEAHPALKELGVQVFGLSTQDTSYQQEMAERLQLPFPVLSDIQLQFQKALKLPTFVIEEKTLIKRLTMVVNEGLIQQVHYPVFPSDADAAWVLRYLQTVV